MRPRELTLQGFRSYRERTTFDLRDRRLIGVVGPMRMDYLSAISAVRAVAERLSAAVEALSR